MSYIETHPTLKHKRKRNSKIEWYNQALKAHLPMSKSARILEIGPGLGDGLRYLTDEQKFENVYGVDIDEGVANGCKNLIGSNMQHTMDVKAYLHDRLEYFDCIIMYHVVEHIERNEIIAVFSAIKDSLNQHGKLIIVTPNAASPIIGMDQFLIDFTHKTPFSPHSLEQALRLSGFSYVLTDNIWPPKNGISRYLQRALQVIVLGAAKSYLNIFSATKRKVMTHQILAVAKRE